MRFYKGSYFLNTSVNSTEWNITRLTLNYGYLTFSNLYADDSTSLKIQHITPVTVTEFVKDSSNNIFQSNSQGI